MHSPVAPQEQHRTNLEQLHLPAHTAGEAGEAAVGADAVFKPDKTSLDAELSDGGDDKEA